MEDDFFADLENPGAISESQRDEFANYILEEDDNQPQYYDSFSPEALEIPDDEPDFQHKSPILGSGSQDSRSPIEQDYYRRDDLRSTGIRQQGEDNQQSPYEKFPESIEEDDQRASHRVVPELDEHDSFREIDSQIGLRPMDDVDQTRPQLHIERQSSELGDFEVHRAYNHPRRQSIDLDEVLSQHTPRGYSKHLNDPSPKEVLIRSIEKDSDDDMMVIVAAEASSEAQEKWRKDGERPRLQDGEATFVEQEFIPVAPIKPDFISMTSEEAFALQREMLENSNKHRAQRRAMRGQNSQNGKNNLSGGNPRNFEDQQDNNCYVFPTRNALFAEEREDLGKVDAAMGGTNNFDVDNSWMHRASEDEEEDAEYSAVLRLKATLEEREHKGRLNADDKMELNRADVQILKKQKLLANIQRGRMPHVTKRKINGKGKERASDIPEKDAEESLFVRENSEQARLLRRRDLQARAETVSEDEDENEANKLGQHLQASQKNQVDNEHLSRMMHELVDGDGRHLNGPPNLSSQDWGLTKSGKPRKRAPRGKVATSAREVAQMQQDSRIEKERRKAQKKKIREPNASANHGRSFGGPITSTRSRDKAAKEKKGKGKGKGRSKQVVTNGTSLLRSGSGYKGHFRGFGHTDPVAELMLNLMADDPLHNRLHNPIFNAPAEAEIHGRVTKQTQFSQLFSNIPSRETIGGMGGDKRDIQRDKRALRDASKAFGFAKVTAEGGKWRIKGMRSTLYHHQLLGAQWMVQRELSPTVPHGGLLADAMGLGKTVQTLSCMVGNPPNEHDLKRKTKATLIVVPSAVIDQWIEEIRFHVEKKVFPKVLRYKRAHQTVVEILEDVDIVVTSYTDVMKEFVVPGDPEEQAIFNTVGAKKWLEGARERMGNLHNVCWYRIVLDEAQAIKNNNARTSLACQNLKSVYKWCLTGTPLLNRLEELFPYLRFLEAKYSMDWSTFQKYFCDVNNEDCYSRINTLLSYVMMRRTMATTILNRPIITLPKPIPTIHFVEFSKEEQIIYRITENRFRSNLNKYFRQGDAHRNYSAFMVQLLRLRQCTSHPFMLEGTIRDMWTLEDVQELKNRLSALRGDAKEPQMPFYMSCKAWVAQTAARREELQAQDEDVDDMELLPFGGSSYGNRFNMDKALEELDEDAMAARLNCACCQDFPNNPLRTDDCLTAYMHDQTANGNEHMTCPNCDMIFIRTEPFDLPPDMRADEDRGATSRPRSKSKSKAKGKEKGKGNGRTDASAVADEDLDHAEQEKSKGRDVMGCEPLTFNSTWIARSDVDEEFDLAPSSKTTMLKSILLKGFDEAPDDKVVIYVQFRALARVVGRICNAEQWQFLYLTGDSPLEHRTKVIKRFRDDREVKILIAGLKCGGLGLNFPWANRCIALDLWWNHAVEQQAFGRIFRIGQTKQTYMTRIVVKNSVDMRMLSMQLHKLKSLGKAIRDGHEKCAPSLSLKQLANLFGFLKTDEDENILSVEADYEED